LCQTNAVITTYQMGTNQVSEPASMCEMIVLVCFFKWLCKILHTFIMDKSLYVHVSLSFHSFKRPPLNQIFEQLSQPYLILLHHMSSNRDPYLLDESSYTLFRSLKKKFFRTY
jgi:hypothetical protein